MSQTDTYLKAKALIDAHAVCGNWNGGTSGHGCNHVFKKENMVRTTEYGQTYYWCKPCYETVKDS